MKHLLAPLSIRSLSLKNRIVMAPLTRCRAPDPLRIPNELICEYYSQRAQAGLIITEATAISPNAVGYNHTPGIWSPEQIDGWKSVTQAVHAQGGVIFLQLWHAGRMSDPIFLNGKTPVAPSAIAPEGPIKGLTIEKNYSIPHVLEIHEIKHIIEEYRIAAANAKKAGFDGVELHGANGYLPDQFLQDSTNHRKDDYGGSIANRARFMLETTDALISIWGSDRVGVHLAPRCDAHSMGDSDPQRTFTYVAGQLGQRNIGFLCSRESKQAQWLAPQLKKAFGGVYIANENFTVQQAEESLQLKEVDAIAFGQLFISNPDLPHRIKAQLPLAEAHTNTFFTQGPEGYIDYPFAT